MVCLQPDFVLLMATLWAPLLELIRRWYKFLVGSESFKSCYFIHFMITFRSKEFQSISLFFTSQTEEFQAISLFYLFYLKRWKTKETAQ